MTSRERVLAAIEHRTPDRLPVDLGGSIMSGISVFALGQLRAALKLPESVPKAYELYQMLGEIEPDVVEALGIDVLPIEPVRMFFDIPRRDYKSWTHPSGTRLQVPGKFDVDVDSNGNKFIHESGDPKKKVVARMTSRGYYFDMVESQSLSLDFSPPALESLEEKYLKPIESETIDHLQERVGKLTRTGKALFLGMWLHLGPPMVGNSSDWLCVLAGERGYVEELFSLKIEGDLRRLDQLYTALGNSIDIIGVDGYDYGTQRAPLFSPDTFEYAHLPYYKSIIGWIHGHTSWKTWKHSCGAASEFLPMFVEAGLDCINPVQISAAGMDPETIKDRFGGEITFWGGGIDTQHTLPFGVPQEVYEETQRLIRIFGDGGGFVFNPVHNIQANTPRENLEAMIRAIRDSQRNG